MAKVKVKIDLGDIKRLLKREVMTKRVALDLSDTVGKEIVSYLNRGQSPVKGQGRFEAYVSQRESNAEKSRLTDKFGKLKRGGLSKQAKRVVNKKSGLVGAGKYPDMFKRIGKRRRPVNLKLFGGLHKFILNKVKFLKFNSEKQIVRLGFDKAGSKLQKIADAHNNGTLKKQNVPQRKFIPNKQGDRFKAPIERKIRAIFEARIKRMIKIFNFRG